MRAAVTLLLCFGASQAAAQAALGTEAGCAQVAGDENPAEARVALLPGHLLLYDATCQITGAQTGTLLAACSGPEGRFDAVLGIGRAPDGQGVVLSLPEGGGQEALYPCE